MVSPYLSDRQLSELHKSIIQYLSTSILDPQSQDTSVILDQLVSKLIPDTQSYQSYQENLSTSIPPNYLEKKWSTVLNLQKRIYELEKDLETQTKLVEDYDSLLLQNGTTLSSKDKSNWLPKRVRATLRYHQCSVTALAIHPYNSLLVTAGQDGSIVVWNLLDLSEPIKVITNAHSRTVNCLSFQMATDSTSQSILLASASSDLLVKLWDLNSKTFSVPVRTLSGHDHVVSSVIFSHIDPSRLVTCSRDRTIKVWDISSGWCTKTIRGHSDWVRNIDLATNQEGDDEFLLSCSSDQSVRLTNLNSGIGIGLCIGHQQVVEDVAFLPNNDDDDDSYAKVGYKYCASCGRDNLIKIWQLPLPDMSSGAPKPAADPRGKLVYEIEGHTTWVRRLIIHPSGKYLVSCSDDRTIKFWDLKKIASLIKHRGPTIEPSLVLKDHDNFVNVIRFADPVLPDEYYKFAGSNDERDKVKAKKLLEQGIRCYLVSGSADCTAKVWV
ncbi:DEKNAAC102045 [Brettanomyces naardenensis]|uniref:Nuclear distribution protein PAC1 n=1 Tax=Brettanomyces naardenensis TaxID=13370 RepID=A0A448YJR5_BRENA|nr:DEKNAAC102045 [Brettanomyces naardenensis]